MTVHKGQVGMVIPVLQKHGREEKKQSRESNKRQSSDKIESDTTQNSSLWLDGLLNQENEV